MPSELVLVEQTEQDENEKTAESTSEKIRGRLSEVNRYSLFLIINALIILLLVAYLCLSWLSDSIPILFEILMSPVTAVIGVIGFLAQYVDGALGMGYGASSSSILVAIGLAPALVSASVHTAEVFTSLTSSVSHYRLGNIENSIVKPLLTSGIIGGVLGALLLVNIDGTLVKLIVGLILLSLGGRIFLKFYTKKRIHFNGDDFSTGHLIILGLVGSVLDAFGGGGWGPICTSTLVSQNQKEPRYIIGSVNIAEFFTTVAIVLTFGLTLGFESFLWAITIPLIIGGVFAAPLAAYTCNRVSPRHLGIFVGLFLVILNLRTILHLIGLPIP